MENTLDLYDTLVQRLGQRANWWERAPQEDVLSRAELIKTRGFDR
jgi:hypothetical protein